MGTGGLEGRAPTPSDGWDARRRAGGLLRGRAWGPGGRGGVSHRRPLLLCGPAAAGRRSRAREVEPRAAGCGLRRLRPQLAPLASALGAPRLPGPARRQAPERKREGDGARRPAPVPQAPEPQGTAGRGGAGGAHRPGWALRVPGLAGPGRSGSWRGEDRKGERT